ncbi:HIRAN domain-containing protein [Sphingomonas montanisoli]|uniref:HIRAN domain-containing protein n=1 Tax=Sphingomonas montanisoli TaxID=2606412 RepID=A0A5D9BZH0_9SPHN|nr:HIRAN domain-containing protein [Sphingomonas montanisoli]TZG24593.1 hypothetical protein FYJ91_18380 [Sphingomonas montanisoli]
MGWNDFKLPVVGCRYQNDDGTSRQDELRRCQPGEPIDLFREPDNPHDERAVAVVSARGVCVGYISRNYNGWIGSKIDRGYDVRAIVGKVRGLNFSGAELDVVLVINMDGDEPELAGAEHRAWAEQVVRSLAA